MIHWSLGPSPTVGPPTRVTVAAIETGPFELRLNTLVSGEQDIRLFFALIGT
jgi:hypothetical protein